MMEDYYPYLWLAVIVVAAVAEAVTAQMVSIWMVVGGIAALIANLLGAPILAQITVFVAVTAITLAATRRFVKKMMHFKKEDTNAGRYIGKNGVVTAEIDNIAGRGQVNVLGNIWTARSADDSVLPAGTNILVLRIEGVKLIVQPRPQLKNNET